MDASRLGRQVRALRQRRGWRQEDLARNARVSRGTVGRVECGASRELSLATLERLVDALGASMELQLRWQGERLDRLLDAAHAALVERVVRLLRARGWSTDVEVSFAIRGERGSIDILAWHPATTALLVVEVKSVIADVQSTISTLDRKRRLAPLIARDRGWPAQGASRLLVVADGRTARRRVAEHETVFRVAFPDRGLAVHAWTRRPVGRISGLIFVPNAHQAGVRQRVRPRRRPRDLAPRSENDATEVDRAHDRA